MPGVANQSETNGHISYCVTAKSHIIHVGTHEHHPISSSRKHVPLLSYIYCNITHQHDKARIYKPFICMLFSRTSDNYARAA